MSSYLRLRKLRLGGAWDWIRSAQLLQALALAAALCLVIGAAAARGAQTRQQPEANPKAAPGRLPQQPAPATPPGPNGMSYRTTTNRTAVWIGDQFHYLITVDYTSEYEFVLDNLNKENVNLDPFSVIDVQKSVTPFGKNQKRLLVDITLANFSLMPMDARIPQLSLYYFRKDQLHGSAEQAAAESLTIIGPMIGLRTTLPANPTDIRDGFSTAGWPRSRWILPASGYAALVFLLAWLGWEAFLFVQARKTKQGPDRRVSMEAVRTRWVRSLPTVFSDGQATKDFFDRSYLNLKEYLGYYLDMDTAGLTADELNEEMRRRGASNDVMQKVSSVLNACEVARYAGNGTAASAESARGVAQDVRELLSLAPKD